MKRVQLGRFAVLGVGKHCLWLPRWNILFLFQWKWGLLPRICIWEVIITTLSVLGPEWLFQQFRHCIYWQDALKTKVETWACCGVGQSIKFLLVQDLTWSECQLPENKKSVGCGAECLSLGVILLVLLWGGKIGVTHKTDRWLKEKCRTWKMKKFYAVEKGSISIFQMCTAHIPLQ